MTAALPYDAAMSDTPSLDEVIATACPKIRDLGWAFYFDPVTMQRGTELGIDGFRFYFIGRGGVLGDVEPAVVSSAFGYFNPTLIADMWTSAREIVAPRVAAAAFVECAAEYGRAHLTDVEGLDAFVAAADAVHGAADPTALALYAGLSAEPLAADAPARAMQLLALLREYRGGAHLVALRAVGLHDKTAQFINRPGDAAMFGWAADEVVEITDDDRARREAAEALTDDIVRPAYAVLDPAGRAALLAGLDAIEAAITGG